MKNQNLSYAHIRVVPTSQDWGTGYVDQWDIVLPSTDEFTFEQCKNLITEYYIDFDKFVPYEDDEEENEDLKTDWIEGAQELISEYHNENMHLFEPMMNYFTELEYEDSQEMANKFFDSCFTVIEFNDGTCGVALTGGGMDMSWEICKAFIDAGFYPPAHYCKLPAMAGRGNSDSDRAIIGICNKSLQAVADGFLRDIENNNDIFKSATLGSFN